MDDMEHSGLPAERVPGEVVEAYTRPVEPVTEVYGRPLPASMRPAPEGAAKPGKKKRRRRKRRRRLWPCVLASMLGAAVGAGALLLGGWYAMQRLWPVFPEDYGYYYYDGPEDDGPRPVNLPTWDPEGALELSLTADHGERLTPQAIYEKVIPSVAFLHVLEGEKGYLGTGVIFTEDGYLLTNYHMVEGGDRCKVLLSDNSVYWASYVAGDRDSDIAVLKVAGENLPAAELADSGLLTVGDKVYAIGNPLSVELRNTFTDGIVSAIDRTVSVDGRNMELLQTNAALNSGNSGGPLVNEYGQVIGINTIKMVSSYTHSDVEGLGFAIPTACVRDIVEELLESGEVRPDPVLGISVSQLGDPLPDGQAGLLIQSVTPDGPADRAGVRKGDYILTADGQRITFSSELYQIRRRFRTGGVLELTLWRNGETVAAALPLDGDG